MTDWNFDISQAPRGRTVQVTRQIGKNAVQSDEHTPDMVIAAGSGGIVTTSHWLPKEGRWNRFTKDTPPLAWMPWPAHPHAGKKTL